MRPVVAQAFLAATKPLEGWTRHPYLDQHRGKDGKLEPLVTVGLGFLIDPLPLALALDWTTPSGARATPSEIEEEWRRVKRMTALAPHGGGAFASVTRLRITDAEIARITGEKLDRFDLLMGRHFHAWEDWPAAAQLGCLSLCWACGDWPVARTKSGALAWPHLTAALRHQPPLFAAAVEESHLQRNEQRSALNRILFRHADRVLGEGLDPDSLPWSPVDDEHAVLAAITAEIRDRPT